MLLLVLSSILGLSMAGPGYWPFTKWPKGTFGLPKAKSKDRSSAQRQYDLAVNKYLNFTLYHQDQFPPPPDDEGCPIPADFRFKEGTRTSDCADETARSSSSAHLHLDLYIDEESDVHMKYCLKNDDISESLTGGAWPSGQYCFYRVGGSCPTGFQQGWILWQDEGNDNRNAQLGELPDGEYLRGSTQQYFCCRTDGDVEVPMQLPRDVPFILLKYGDTCQAVEGTRFIEEYVIWDNEPRGNQKRKEGTTPEAGVDMNGDVDLKFCYYTAISYCGTPGEVGNGTVTGERYTAGSTLTFSCDEGYKLSGYEEITCNTNEKWSADTPSCNEVHNCEENNGGCDDICIDLESGKHKCECSAGFNLEGQGDCVDINECKDPELAGKCEQLCLNTRGSYECGCKKGYKLNPDERTCDDIDECDSDSPPCEQICTNTVGGYNCSCHSGYSIGSPPNTCDDINECVHEPCAHLCDNIEGSFKCRCLSGWVIESDNRTCRNLHPCADNKFNRCKQYCTETSDNEFVCGCKDGYVLNSDQISCDDINECTDGTAKCSQTCINTEPGYTCACQPGYVLAADGYSCRDIDECSCNTTAKRAACGGCQQQCINTVGSYYCKCDSAYVPLRPDSTQCILPYSKDDPCITLECYGKNAECHRDGDRTACRCFSGYSINKTTGYCESCSSFQRLQDGECISNTPVKPKDNNGTSNAVTNSDTVNNTTTWMIILITVAVVVIWIVVMIIVIVVMRRKRSNDKMPRMEPYAAGRPSQYPTMTRTIDSPLMQNPLYAPTTPYIPQSSDDDNHIYEELDKQQQAYFKKKLAQQNNYHNGCMSMDQDDAYSYAVTPGPPPPSHLLPPPPSMPLDQCHNV